MHKNQIDIIQIHPFQRLIHGSQRLFIRCIGTVDLGCDKQFCAVNAAAADSFADFRFIAIHDGGIDQSVPGADCLINTFHAFLCAQIPCAETHGRHLNSIVQCFIFHKLTCQYQYDIDRQCHNHIKRDE